MLEVLKSRQHGTAVGGEWQEMEAAFRNAYI